MPRISTDNYDTVASWNGSQDLFVVEQPDGTKVATPAMVKQFIEAGDFEATGEVKDGHGNILADMAKSADVDAEIGDLSQTGLTGDSVAAQLATARGGIADVNTALANLIKIKDIAVNSASTGHAAPFQSQGGSYYEALVTYESIGVAPANVLNIMPSDWSGLQKAFTVYRGNISIGVISDSSTSIYKDNNSKLVLRIVYK